MMRTKLFLACALAFAVSLAGTAATAQEPTNQITYFTFSAPFELPGGKTLPAGKYVFKIVDSPSNRHVVQVMSEDQQTMHATVMAIPAQRQDPADEPEVRFMEAAANAAPAIRTWWYPGRSIGHEFIYPKDHARRLAANQTGEGVLTTAGDAVGDDAMKSVDLARIGANGEETAWAAENRNAENAQSSAAAQSAQTTAANTTNAQSSATPSTAQTTQPSTSPAQTATTQENTTAQSSSTQASAATASSAQRSASQPTTREATTDTPARTELPRTASLLPLIGLLGLGSMLGAGALRFRR
jgi:hypothetical protein